MHIGRVTHLSLPVPTYHAVMPRMEYDEFSLFHENLAEWGLDVPVPRVTRQFFEVAPGRRISALVWGDGPPTLALIHGGAQNAHTFDTVALALQSPLVSFDLPGHGHSDGAPYGVSAVASHAHDVATALATLVDHPVPLLGMSMGGLTAIVLTHDHPELVSRLILVDVTPGVNREKSKHITDFVNGPATFPDFDALLARTTQHNPTRTESSLRRGILHNAVQNEDGSWVWRHQRHPQSELTAPPVGDLWEQISTPTTPLLLVRGMAAGSVVDDADEAELVRRRPDAQIVHVANAGHSVQGDAPLELAAAIAAFVGS
jgi:pimeloyl-ACP methyl ester carboxylesterase